MLTFHRRSELPDQFLCVAGAPILLAALALEAVPTRKAEHRIVRCDQFLCIAGAPILLAALALEAALTHKAEHRVCRLG
jgi:hypothetical protein